MDTSPEIRSAVNELIELLVDAVEFANSAFERQRAARVVAERLSFEHGIPYQRLAELAGISLDSVESILDRTPLPLSRRLHMDEESVDVLLERVAKRRRWTGLSRASYSDRLHLDSVVLRTLLTRAPVGFGMLDPDLRFVLVNDALAAMNGVPVEAHLGRTIFEVVPGLAEEAAEPFRRVLGTGEPLLNLELRGITAAEPGTVRTWYENVYRVTDSRGILGLAVVVVELNDRREAGASPSRDGAR
jgi:PAS domain S-box-containing protein